MFWRAKSINTGCSPSQAVHHDAHTLSIHTLPFMSCGENCLDGSCNCGSVNAGAGLPTNGDGTSRGFNPSPTYMKAAIIMKTTNGSMKRIMMVYPLSLIFRLCRLGLPPPVSLLLPSCEGGR